MPMRPGPLGTFDGDKRARRPSASTISCAMPANTTPLVVKTVNGNGDPPVDIATIAPERAQQPLGRLVQRSGRRSC